MAKAKKRAPSFKKVIEVFVGAIQDKKGEEIVCLDLRKLEDAVADYFIICHGDSQPQVKAITDSVAETAQKVLDEKPWHMEGYSNLEWVLMDYVNVVVHVFLRDKRYFYNLEELWSDAKAKVYRTA